MGVMGVAIVALALLVAETALANELSLSLL